MKHITKVRELYEETIHWISESEDSWKNFLSCMGRLYQLDFLNTSESVQEIISDNEIDSLVSDPDKVVDIIMYVKNEAAKQDISDDQIRSLIQTAESTAGVSLSEEEENRIIKIVKQIKDSDIDEEQLRSAVTKAYDKLEEMGIGKEEVKGILHKLADFAKSLFE